MSLLNTTQLLNVPQTQFLTTAHPFYYSPVSELIPGFSDHELSVAAPVLAYWFFSLLFHSLDISGWKWLERYRIHESAEVQKRNRVTKMQVIWAVVFQHVLQTALAYWWIDSEAQCGGSVATYHLGPMLQLADSLRSIVLQLFGPTLGEQLWKEKADEIIYVVYWWGIPIAQMFFAMFIIDSWQYFLHRAMHMNQFLYRHLHSVHHRLYVPYAFGALYNHPVEGFLLDSLGAVIAEQLSGMSVRQAMFLFTVSTFKTVDDHCGYSLPFDPLQFLTSNNADYHDIHHQVIGIKSNFSQPFFVHWDTLLGTKMTRKDIATRRQQKLDSKKDQ